MLQRDRKQEDLSRSVRCLDDDADGASLAARFLVLVGLALPEIVEANDVAGSSMTVFAGKQGVQTGHEFVVNGLRSVV